MEFTTTIRARFAETDQMGVVHHSHYVVWCEAARVEWLRQRNVSYKAIEDEGISLAVSAFSITYRRAVLFDDEITIRAEVTELRSRRIAFAYELLHEDGMVAAKATSVHVPTDRTGRAIRLPPHWFTVFSQLVTEAR